MFFATIFRCLFTVAALFAIGSATVKKGAPAKNWTGTYLIALPKALQPGIQHTVSVQIQSKNVGLRIDTTNPDNNKTVTGSISTFPNGNGIVNYGIPFANYVSKSVRLTFVGISCAANVKKCSKSSKHKLLFSKSTVFPVIQNSVVIFTESSKPIYKPSEEIKFRILPIIPNTLQPMRIVNGKSQPLVIDLVYLQSPNNMRMAQWTNITWLQALKGMSYLLSADPIFGDWKIKTQIGDVKDTEIVKVKKYVLPKFTVSIEPPSHVFITDSVVKFRVCAKYSTGRPMKAVVKATFCIKSTTLSTFHRRVRRPCIRSSKVLNGGQKCVEFEESTKILQLRNSSFPYWGRKAFVNATVTEEGTGVAITKTKFGGELLTTLFKYSNKLPKLCRPGLPYYGQIQILNNDDSVRPNQTVMCQVTSHYKRRWEFYTRFTSDANGYINIAIPAFPPENSFASIRIFVDKSSYKTIRGIVSVRYPSLYARISTIYSPTNTHIQAYPLESRKPQTPCSRGKFKVLLQSNVPLHDKLIYVYSASRANIQFVRSFKESKAPKTICKKRDSPELGHYKCVPQKNGSFKIRCLPGWRGTNCLIPICEKGCLKGVCRSPGHCACRHGWGGAACNKCIVRKECVHGHCHYGGDCSCKKGYGGYLCNRPIEKILKNGKKPYRPYHPPYRPPVDTLPVNKTKKYDPAVELEDWYPLFSRRLQIPIPPKLYPSTQLVIWFVHKSSNKTEIVTTNIKLTDLRKCLSKFTPTLFSFDKKSVRPGETVNATIKTSGKNAKCALSVADVALDAFGTRGGVTEKNLFEEIKAAVEELQRWHHLDPYNIMEQKHCGNHEWRPPMLPMPQARRPIRILPPGRSGPDTSHFFRDAGIFVVSNIPIMTAPCIRLPVIGPFLRNRADAMAPVAVKRKEAQKEGGAEVKKVRKVRLRTFFPETWLFELKENPKSKISLKVPDSMTTWMSTMYCVTSKGLGLSPPDRLVVFQPFFVSLSLPYSLVRGETANIPVKVFSYRKECSEITLTMKPSKYLTFERPQVVRSCICNFNHITAYFRVQPKKLGKIPIEVEAVSRQSSRCSKSKTSKALPVVADAVRRSLLVEAEGIREEISVGDLLCPAGKSASAELKIATPNKTDFNIVEGSERAYLTYSGNVIGSSLENLDSMLRMPYGCGEQNMVSMVPSIYVLKYFTMAGINNAKIKEKAQKFILIGYQRQMAYRLNDGSYSAFGKRDKVGSTWLTAFVFRSFVDAGQYVTVDSKVLSSALKFLLSKANKSGCFREDGRVIHSAMKGGQGKGKDEAAITAYILAALAEASGVDKSFVNETAPGIEAAVRCLNTTLPTNKSALKKMSNYGVALRAYALTLWNPSNKLTKIFTQELQRRKTKKDGFVYWKASDKEVRAKYMRPWVHFVSADVETTAYALLSILAKTGRNGNNLVNALPILRWLTNQRNEKGGWISTQDTITALSALSEFAGRVSDNGKGTNLEVIIETKKNKRTLKKITNKNNLVLFKMPITVPNTLKITTKGVGCLVAQANVLFNVKETGRLGAPFSLKGSATQSAKQCDMASVRVCVRYTGASEESDMAVIKARMASGWQVTKKSIEQLNKNVVEGGLKRIEVDPDKSLILYFDYFTSNQSCTVFTMQRDIEVTDVKPMLILVYDYYKPHETQETNVQVVNKICDRQLKAKLKKQKKTLQDKKPTVKAKNSKKTKKTK